MAPECSERLALGREDSLSRLLPLPQVLALFQSPGPPLTIRQRLEAHLAAELAVAGHRAGTHLYHVHHAGPQAIDPCRVGLAPGHGGVELIVLLKKSKKSLQPAPEGRIPTCCSLEHPGPIR